MGIDVGSVRAFGYLNIGVVAVSGGVSALIAFGTGNSDMIWLFLPLLVGYSLFIALLSISLAVYVFVRSRTQRLH